MCSQATLDIEDWQRKVNRWSAGPAPAGCLVSVCVVTLCHDWLDIYVNMTGTVGCNMWVKESVIKVDCSYLILFGLLLIRTSPLSNRSHYHSILSCYFYC